VHDGDVEVTATITEDNVQNVSYFLWDNSTKTIIRRNDYYTEQTTTTFSGMSAGVYIINASIYDDGDRYNESNKVWITYTIAKGLDCKTNYNPWMKPELLNKFSSTGYMEWVCDLNATLLTEDVDCVSYVKDIYNRYLLQTNPKKEYLKGIGEISTFAAIGQNKIVRARFTEKNLLPEEDFIFGVSCKTTDNRTFVNEINATPTYKDLRVVAYRTVWVKDQFGFIIPIIMLISVVLLLVTIYTRKRWLF